jgi:CRP-like cAMP-binding protein
MNAKAIDITGILKSCSVFADLGESALRELNGKARVEHFSERTLLNLRGEKQDYLRYVISGSVDMVLSTADGGYSCLPVLPGRWATWLGCFGAEPLVHDLWSSAHATAVAFPCRDLQKAVADNPQALQQVIERVGEWSRFLTGWMLSFSVYAPEKRLAYLLLLASSKACGIAHEGEPTALTQAHIGQFGFGSRQKVGRLLRSLADRGLIGTRYGAIVIPSRAKLEAFISDSAPDEAELRLARVNRA